MSWASRMRTKYIVSIGSVFAVLIGVPLVIWLYEPASCFDGELNQGEYSIDRGGPCTLLDSRALIPHAVLWTQEFKVRDGLYNAVAYIENPNQGAGVIEAPYRLKLYDDRNVLVAERTGVTFVMPGNITPIFVGSIPSGERTAARAFLEFAAPLVWERLYDRTKEVKVTNKRLRQETTTPRITAEIENDGVKDLTDVEVVAVVFDTAGNAFAASSTNIPLLPGGEKREVVFTWPAPFEYKQSRIDVIVTALPSE